MSERIVIVPIETSEWWAKLIRWVLQSRWNHIFILFEDSTLGGWWSIDIRNDGVHVIAAEKSSLTRLGKAEFYECNHSLLPALQQSRKLVGSGYDWLGLSMNLFRLLLWRFLKIKWLKPVHSLGRMTCVEYVTTFLRIGCPVAIDKYEKEGTSLEPAVTRPQEDRDFMSDSGAFYEVENPLKFGGAGE